MVHDFEDRRWKGRVSSDVKLTEDGIIGDDRIIGWDEQETQPCTGADNFEMTGDGEDDANEDEKDEVRYTEMTSEKKTFGRDSLFKNNELTTQPGTAAEKFMDGVKSPEMTVKALLNNQPGVRERVLKSNFKNEKIKGYDFRETDQKQRSRRRS